jgi:threonine dehydrogenase-like Zn-dependent dehydrogenase
MKAVAVFPRRKEIELVHQEEPGLTSPTQVKLRMLEVGICGTDREICSFHYGTPPPGQEYLVIGHESLGEVVQIGSAVTRCRVGDLVVPTVRRPCVHPDCLACRADRPDFCFTGDYTERGIKQLHGYLTELVVDDQKYMNPVPHDLRNVGILVEPLTIAEKALSEIVQVQQRLPWGCPTAAGNVEGYRHKAVVLGAGPVGLLGAMTLVVAGFKTYVYSRSPEPARRAALVESIGSTFVPAETTSVPKLAEQVGSIDLVFEAAGASSLAFEVMPHLGINGIFVFTGVPGRKSPITVDTSEIMRDLVLKNQVVFGSVNAGQSAFERAIRDLGVFVKRWPEAVRSLITGRHAIEAHRACLAGPPAGIKEVITLG